LRLPVAGGSDAGISAGLRARELDPTGLGTSIAPSTVTGVGAGALLTVFTLAALAGVPAARTPALGSADRPV
jgi:hypothetical protein